MITDEDVCRACGYTRRADDPDLIRGLCVRAHHEGDPSCWSRAGHPEPLSPDDCSTCEGTGEVASDFCPTCHGTGSDKPSRRTP